MLRHAKSSWDDLTLKDFDRPLNYRGRNDAKKIGNRLLNLDLIPELIISSSSLRTKQTVEILKSVTVANITTKFTQDLYHANPEVLKEHFLKYYKDYKIVMLVGHNPGIYYLFEQLSNVSIVNYPTCSFSVFKYNETEESFNLLNFESPKKNYLS